MPFLPCKRGRGRFSPGRLAHQRESVKAGERVREKKFSPELSREGEGEGEKERGRLHL